MMLSYILLISSQSSSTKQAPDNEPLEGRGTHDTSGKGTTTLPDSQSSSSRSILTPPPLSLPAAHDTLSQSSTKDDGPAGFSPIEPTPIVSPAGDGHSGDTKNGSPPILSPPHDPQSATSGDISLRDVKPDDWKLSKKTYRKV